MISGQINDKLKEIHQVKLEEIKSLNTDLLPARTVDICSFSKHVSRKEELALIAEIKRASPSKGLIRPDFDLDQIIKDYLAIPVDAVSVLTDQQFFSGHTDYLRHVKINSSVPVLRKDFIISEEQIHESYSMGADMILLITAMLSSEELSHLIEITSKMGMDALVEAHTEDEIHAAVAAGAEIIGINNRDLNTFKVDLNTALQLVRHIPDGIIKIAESGIHTHDDIKQIALAGFDAVLIGEAFMVSNNIRGTYNQLFSE